MSCQCMRLHLCVCVCVCVAESVAGTTRIRCVEEDLCSVYSTADYCIHGSFPPARGLGRLSVVRAVIG